MNNKKIGILLAFAPGQSLKTQGIGRLLCFLISGAKYRSKFTIIIPKWYKNQLIDLLEDQHIEKDQYELLTTSKEPYLLKAKTFTTTILKKTTSKKSPIQRVQSILLKMSKKIVNFLISSLTGASLPLFLIALTLASLLMTLLVSSLFFIPFLWPMFVIFSLLMFAFMVWKFLQSLPLRYIASKFLPPHVFNYCNQYEKYFLRLLQPLKNLKHNRITQKFYQSMRTQEVNKLIRLVNSRVDINTWFVPALFWPEIKDIKAFTVVAAPDIVFLDFPSFFATDHYYRIYQNITVAADSADHLICYSRYVKEKHLIEKLQLSEEKISVIPHGLIDLAPYLTQHPSLSMRNNALHLLKKYQHTQLKNNNYLAEFDFTNMRFIFYSSHIRPYKNFLTLLKAYEILLRQKYLGIKLVVTGNIAGNPEINDFIKSRRLSHDVLSFYHIPSDMLAALNHLAICSVNPTLFEGGFPFTFSEAYSVGTPSVMSKIAVVEEIIDFPELEKIMLFDPYSVSDMVEKIAFAIEHPDELYQAQKPLYEKLANRSWKTVAEEYLNVFDTVSSDIPVTPQDATGI